jgi:hypothetical protein
MAAFGATWWQVHRDECERLGNYAEATSLGARMHTIRQQQEHNRREEMERNHLADNIKVGSAFLPPINTFLDGVVMCSCGHGGANRSTWFGIGRDGAAGGAEEADGGVGGAHGGV